MFLHKEEIILSVLEQVKNAGFVFFFFFKIRKHICSTFL